MKKKMACLALVLVLMMGCMPTALAADAGIQVIGGPTAVPETVSLDDFKLNVPVEIENYGTLTGLSCDFADSFKHYNDAHYYNTTSTFNSGTEAQYILLKMDIFNGTLSKMNYLKACNVTVYYNEDFKFSGFCYQYNYDHSDKIVLKQENIFDINPLYVGHYLFGCTVPNVVQEQDAPLKIVIELDGNEITYNIRK